MLIRRTACAPYITCSAVFANSYSTLPILWLYNLRKDFSMFLPINGAV